MNVFGQVQPKQIIVNEEVSLVKYYPYYKETIKWYQDPELCKQVDNIDYVYDKEKLSKMYRYLNKNGEVYYIKFKDNGRYKLIGDVSLWNNTMAIVIRKEYQNKHIGRAVVKTILNRARKIGKKEIIVEIYSFNKQSQKMFLSVGFKKIDEEHLKIEL